MVWVVGGCGKAFAGKFCSGRAEKEEKKKTRALGSKSPVFKNKTIASAVAAGACFILYHIILYIVVVYICMFVCAERVKTRDFNCSSGISSSLDVYTTLYIVRKRAFI